jgi:hypothetical protein
MVSEPVRPATWGSLRLSLTRVGFIILFLIELIVCVSGNLGYRTPRRQTTGC